jgi:hypothetical protein
MELDLYCHYGASSFELNTRILELLYTPDAIVLWEVTLSCDFYPLHSSTLGPSTPFSALRSTNSRSRINSNHRILIQFLVLKSTVIKISSLSTIDLCTKFKDGNFGWNLCNGHLRRLHAAFLMLWEYSPCILFTQRITNVAIKCPYSLCNSAGRTC